MGSAPLINFELHTYTYYLGIRIYIYFSLNVYVQEILLLLAHKINDFINFIFTRKKKKNGLELNIDKQLFT